MTAIRVAGRADYGARSPRGPLAPFTGAPASTCFIHNTVTPTYGADWRRAARAVQDAAFSRGFFDTSYPVLVHVPTGTVIEGRGAQWIGAHTSQWNSRAQAVSLIGNYDAGPLSDLGVAATRYAIALLVSTGYLRADAEIRPHRAVYPTACPGRYTIGRLGEIRQPWAGGPGGEFVMDAEAKRRFDQLEKTLGRWMQEQRRLGVRDVRQTIWRAVNRIVDVGEALTGKRIAGRDDVRADPPPELE